MIVECQVPGRGLGKSTLKKNLLHAASQKFSLFYQIYLVLGYG